MTTGRAEPAVFLAHSSRDAHDFVIPLAAALRRHRLDPWLDRHEIEEGEGIPTRVFEAIAAADVVVIVFSPGMASRWVPAECAAACHSMIVRDTVVLPVLLDGASAGIYSWLRGIAVERSPEGVVHAAAAIARAARAGSAGEAAAFLSPDGLRLLVAILGEALEQNTLRSLSWAATLRRVQIAGDDSSDPLGIGELRDRGVVAARELLALELITPQPARARGRVVSLTEAGYQAGVSLALPHLGELHALVMRRLVALRPGSPDRTVAAVSLSDGVPILVTNQFLLALGRQGQAQLRRTRTGGLVVTALDAPQDVHDRLRRTFEVA